ncbi:MAG: methyltransferase domain-containing protein [Neisseriaceae bacterium]|nr:methyltransferase domain-containing protein [Neisseriaceae bacterium]
MVAADFGRWAQNEPAGQYVLAQEQAFYDQHTEDIFGYYAVQIGLPERWLLRQSRIAHRLCVAPYGAVDVYAQSTRLPLDCQSMDLVVLPHGLEATPHPHQVLSEIHRVLVPDGKLLLTGFNPASLWGLPAQLPHVGLPARQHMVGWLRVKDWLAFLGFEVVAWQFMVYVPPCRQEGALQRWRALEKLGPRLWPKLGAVYGLHLVKRTPGVHPLKMAWQHHAGQQTAPAPIKDEALLDKPNRQVNK